MADDFSSSFSDFLDKTVAGPPNPNPPDQDPSAPAAPDIQPSDDFSKSFGGFLDNQVKQTQQQAQINLIGANKGNPDQAVKAQGYASQTGIPFDTTMRNMDQVADQAKIAQQSQVLKANPPVADWLSKDPQNAAIAHDDISNLGFFSKTLEAFKSGFSSGTEGAQLGELGAERATGATGDDLDAQIAQKQKELAAQPQMSGFYGGVQEVSNFGGMMLDNLLRANETGVKSAIGGAAALGAIGAAAGAPAAGIGAVPGAAGGAITGAVGGYGIGFGVGLKSSMARQAYGNAYLSLNDAKDQNGQPLGEIPKQVGAALTGAITYGLAEAGGAVVNKGIASVSSRFVSDAMTQAMERPTVMTAIANITKKVGAGAIEGGAINAGMTAAQMAGEEIAKQIDPGTWDKLTNDPVLRQQAVDNLAQSFEHGMLLFGGLKGAEEVGGFGGDLYRARQAQIDHANFQSVADGTMQSKLRDRAPDAFQQFAQTQTNGTPVENLFIPASKVRELYQSHGIDPYEYHAVDDPIFGSIVPDMKEQLTQALPTDRDIVVPTAGYLAKIVGTPIDEALRPDLRLRQDGMTMREMDEQKQNMPSRLKEMADRVGQQLTVQQQEEEPIRRIMDDAVAQLKAAGQTENQANTNARIVASRYNARAAALEGKGGSAWDLYQSEGLGINRELTQPTAKADYTDVVLNALRSGTKLASDKDLFGPTLSQFIKQRGGIVDTDKELSGMDFDKDKRFKGVIRKLKAGEAVPGGQGELAGVEGAPKEIASEGLNQYGMDDTARAAQEAGYFPEKSGRIEPNDLINALRDEMGGNNRYAGVNSQTAHENFRAAVEQMDETLNRQGIDVKTASNADIKAALAKGEPEPVEGRELGQSSAETGNPRILEQGERGKINLSQGRNIITLFKNADASTFQHEMGHLFLDELMRDAVRTDAPDSLKNDAATVLKWFGADSAEGITDEHHEQFARGYEQYLMEGKAPSQALEGAFSRFKAWMTNIYRTVKSLNVPMNNDIRQVMDRLLATDDEIKSARDKIGQSKVFQDAIQGIMTKAELAAYTKQVEKANNTEDAKLLEKAMKDITRQKTAEWKGEADNVRLKVERDMRNRPDLAADYYLRTGKDLAADNPDEAEISGALKLSRSDLADMYGYMDSKKAPDFLPKGTTADNGAHPDEIAEMFGYHSGEDLINDLMTLEQGRKENVGKTGKPISSSANFARLVDEETQRRMVATHGDFLKDGTIETEALKEVHNAQRGDVMATELRVLARDAGVEPPLSKEAMQNWVRGQMADMPVERAADLASFSRAEAKSGREVERALLKGDIHGAFEAKQRQVLNHLMGMEARDAADDLEAGKKLFQSIAGKPSFSGIDQAYTDQMHALLQRFGFTVNRDPDELQRGLAGESLLNFVQSKLDEGREPVVASFLLNEGAKGGIDTLSLDDFRSLKDAITSLRYLGREENTVMREGKRVDKRMLIDEIIANLKEQPQRERSEFYKPEDAGKLAAAKERALSILRSGDAALLSQESMFDKADMNDPNGPLNSIVFRPLKEAQHDENARKTDVVDHFKGLMETMPDEWQKHLNDRIADQTLTDPRDGKPITFTRKRMLAIILNMGAEDNYQKMLDGYKWDRGTVDSFIKRNATKADYDFAQGMWDAFDKMKGDVDDLQRRVSGIGIKFVEPKELETPFGTYKGGYYPLVYDASRSDRGDVSARHVSADALFENEFYRATTAKGHTISRVDNVKLPVSLDLDILTYKLGQSIHDLSFREAVMNADKVLSNPRFKAAFSDAYGKEYTDTFRPWLKSIANSQNINDNALGFVDKMLHQARMNATMVGIGFRVSTMIKHASTAAFHSVGTIGAGNFANGVREFIGTPQQMSRKWDFVMSKSGEMKNRMDAIDRDTRGQFRLLTGDSSLLEQAQRYGHYGVAFGDMMTAIPTWLGKYRDVLANGGADDDAVYQADKAVRQAHGASGITDLPAIQRGGELMKFNTMFYSFMNHTYNRLRETGDVASSGFRAAQSGDWAGARRDFARSLAMTMSYLIVPAIAVGYSTRGGPQKDESWAGWAAKAIAGEAAGTVPGVRDIVSAALDGRAQEQSPVGRAIDTIKNTALDDLPRALGWKEGKVSDRWLQHAIETGGYVTGWPSGQAGESAQYLWDIGKGSEQPKGAADVIHGLVFGPHPKHANH